MFKQYLLLLASCLLLLACSDPTPPTVVVIGQSNARGLLPLEAAPKDSKLWDRIISSWSDYQVAENRDYDSCESRDWCVGIESQFPPGTKFIKVAIGGTSIKREWQHDGELADKLIESLSGKNVDQILWLQGESDAGYINYCDDFEALVSRFQNETGVLNKWYAFAVKEHESRYKYVNSCFKSSPYSIFVSSTGAETSDGTHYTQKGFRTLYSHLTM
ncbi:MAG: sialate O-acetylesterase [Vibrio toranzoniae]|uniref:sialate O-acetylesterase n=1 Tax=Vibrio toranzoniae TaxID=1194427 RepID=UPI003F94C747